MGETDQQVGSYRALITEGPVTRRPSCHTACRVVGLNRTQDGSISVARGTPRIYSLQKERVGRRKHHWGRLGDQTDLYLSRRPFLDDPVDLVVECFSWDSEFERVAEYEAELEAPSPRRLPVL